MAGEFALFSTELVADILEIGSPRAADLEILSTIGGFWGELAAAQKKRSEEKVTEVIFDPNDIQRSLNTINTFKVTAVRLDQQVNYSTIEGTTILRTLLQCPTVRSVIADDVYLDYESAYQLCLDFVKKPGFLELSAVGSFHPERPRTLDEIGDSDDEEIRDYGQSTNQYPKFGEILQHWLDLETFPPHMQRFAFNTPVRDWGRGQSWFQEYGMFDMICTEGESETFHLYHPNDQTRRIQILCTLIHGNCRDEQLIEMCLSTVQASEAEEFSEYDGFVFNNRKEIYAEFEEECANSIFDHKFNADSNWS